MKKHEATSASVIAVERIYCEVFGPVKAQLPVYPYRRAASGGMTLTQLFKKRLVPTFGNLPIVIRDGAGKLVRGNKKLKSIRETYY